jgi:hypothetical protein
VRPFFFRLFTLANKIYCTSTHEPQETCMIWEQYWPNINMLVAKFKNFFLTEGYVLKICYTTLTVSQTFQSFLERFTVILCLYFYQNNRYSQNLYSSLDPHHNKTLHAFLFASGWPLIVKMCACYTGNKTLENLGTVFISWCYGLSHHIIWSVVTIVLYILLKHW